MSKRVVGAFILGTGMALSWLVAPAAGAQAPVAAAAPESAEARRGRLLYIQCRACHELKAGAPNKVGPTLHGIFGAKSAAHTDFAYSPALKAANLVWDRVTLDRWLEKPSSVVPGNTMAFAGIASPKDRQLLLDYIAAESAPASSAAK